MLAVDQVCQLGRSAGVAGVHDDLVPVVEKGGGGGSAESSDGTGDQDVSHEVLSFAWLTEVAVDGGVVDVDALVGELAVDEGEDRTGVDLDLSVVVKAPDACDLEDDHVVVFLPDVDYAGGPVT